MRLDFTSFAISGPSTLTAEIGKQINGQIAGDGAMGIAYSLAGTCQTDVFTISGAMGVPPLCGKLDGEHSKFFTYRPNSPGP